jgi:4-nitrophenyl phosphatase
VSTPVGSAAAIQPSCLQDLLPPVRGLILDMDGVLWKENAPIGDLAAVFNRLASRGIRVAAATNNATKTVAEYVEKLHGFGVTFGAWQIVGSADATAAALASRLPQRGAVFVVGEGGVIEALLRHGFAAVTEPDNTTEVVAVVAGLDRTLTYDKLRRAASDVRRGIPFYGTNADVTFPTPEGLIPGAGSIIAAIEAAAGVKPTVTGKPAPFMFELAAERLQLTRDDILVVGDRLETDIAGGQAFGARTALVLSGVSTPEQAYAWKPRPDLIAEDLTHLVGN